LTAKSNSFNEALKALKNALNAAYQLAPAVVVIGLILAAIVAYVSLFFIEVLQGLIIILIIFISALVYYKSNNYGEAALSLVVGLLAAFTVDWTWNKSFVFMMALLGFLLFVLLIGSIKLAAKNEDIYLDAAIYIDVNRAKETAQKLRKISDSTPTKKLGPIDKAEAIRIMAFRKISTDSMNYMLKTIDIITGITNLDAKYVTLFLISLSKAFNVIPGPSYEREIDKIFSFYRIIPVSRDEFIQAFMNSRSLLISGKVDPSRYRLLLKESLENDVSPEDTLDFIQERIGDS